MKKTALIVTILLAAASLLTHTICGGVLGWQVYRAMNGGAVVMEQPDEPEIVEPVDAPVATPEPVVLPERVEMETYFEDSMDYAIIRAYSGSEEVWSRELTPQQSTELDSFSELGIVDGLYLYSDVGTVTALDLATGGIVWENSDFGGAVSGFDWDEQGNIYLTGWYGPDFFLADIEGNTLCRIGEFDPDYYWANGVRKLDDHTAEVTLTMGPGGVEGEFRFRVEEDDGVWSWSGPEGAQTASSADERAWKTAYARFMENQDKYDSYSLLDVGLDVPLLYMNGMTTAQGDLLCYYDAERDAYSTFDLWVDGLCYMPGLNLLWEQGGHMDVYYDKILTVRNGLIICWEAGEYGAVDNSHPETYVYSWNGRAMSEEEYWRALQDAFPMEAAQYADTEACATRRCLRG